MVYLIQNHNALADEQSRPLLLQLLAVSTFFCANHWFTGKDLVRNDFVSGIWSVSTYWYILLVCLVMGVLRSAQLRITVCFFVQATYDIWIWINELAADVKLVTINELAIFIYLFTYISLLTAVIFGIKNIAQANPLHGHYCITDSFSWSEHCFSFYFQSFLFSLHLKLKITKKMLNGRTPTLPAPASGPPRV